MDELMRVMAAKKREAALLQTQKKEKYLRRAEVETILLETTTRESSSSKQTGANTDGSNDALPTDAADATTASSLQQQQTNKKRKLDGETTTQQQQSGGNSSSTRDDSDSATYTLPWAELKKRLREFGEPIRLFGESERERIDRLRKAEHDAASRQEDALGEGHRTRSRFVGEHEHHNAEHADDADDDAEDFDDSSRGIGGDRSAAASGKRSSKASTSTSATGTTIAPQGASDDDEEDESDLDKLVYRFFKRMLQAWEADLAARPDHVKRTAQGKIATKTMKQCKDYIRPLFKLCKTRQVPGDIRTNLVAIVRFCKQGEFVMANDAYIRLAIGNAAWPIGVTMVGIHERTGREKINSNKQAHVMNNESQRKYLTSVKRLISYAQSVSNVLPSKKVLA